jgi:phenylpropionate dioxygenase-like ring-hydroxylating dioxygenase large terminal subunit
VSGILASLRPRDYVDPDVYAREVAHVFAESWLPVCRVDQLEQPGQRVAITLAGAPLVAVRDADTIRVLANVCAHRGSQVVDDGTGSGSTLVCPYHRWAYRLDGSLIGAPLTVAAEFTGSCLPAVRHTTWEGFVLVNLSGTASDPNATLSVLSDRLAPWRWSEMTTIASCRFESTWNWKVMVENWIECYHHLGTHRDSVEPYQPSRNTKIIPSEGAPWAAMTVDSLDGVEGPREEWMPGVDADCSKELSVWAAFPLLLGGSVARYGFWLQIVPIDVTRHDVIWHLVVHRSQTDRFDPERTSELMEMLTGVHAEDMQACRRVQTGLASGFLHQLRLTPLESTIADFQHWIVGHLSAGATDDPIDVPARERVNSEPRGV